MANQHKHRLRGIRGIPDAVWARFGVNTKRAGSDRSSEVLGFVSWYNHEPGAELPARPEPDHDAPPDDTPSDAPSPS